MPGYHLTRADGQGGVTLVNIGVGPSNAKNITDHLAVLRPHCWLMIGHCGGLRQSPAHRRLRAGSRLSAPGPHSRQPGTARDSDPGARRSSGGAAGSRGADHGRARRSLKQRLRTGTVVTNDDRNWELRWTQERKRINLSRAIAVDMESGTLAAQGYRLRVPYGTLLCVSDKPLHGEIKLPGCRQCLLRPGRGRAPADRACRHRRPARPAVAAPFPQAQELRRTAIPLTRGRHCRAAISRHQACNPNGDRRCFVRFSPPAP